MFINLVNFINKSTTLNPCIPNLAKSIPQSEDDDLRFRPSFVDIINQCDVCVVVISRRNVVVGIVITVFSVSFRHERVID